MVQNSGTADRQAPAPRLMNNTESTRLPWNTPSRTKHAAPTSMVEARCQRRSRWRSELRPSRYMATSATRYGRLLIRPMWRMSSRPKPWISVGIQ
ncbi:hypothetical protein D9M71_531980 [compost metagenome]